MPKKNGVALMILEKNKKAKGACSEFLSSIGIEVSEDKEKDACEALLDFVQIALNSDDEDY